MRWFTTDVCIASLFSEALTHIIKTILTLIKEVWTILLSTTDKVLRHLYIISWSKFTCRNSKILCSKKYHNELKFSVVFFSVTNVKIQLRLLGGTTIDREWQTSLRTQQAAFPSRIMELQLLWKLIHVKFAILRFFKKTLKYENKIEYN